MSCDRSTLPEFTKEQIEACEKCKHASGKKVWCCLFGVWIKEQSRIITPDKKIKYPSMMKMAGNFTKESYEYIKEGRPKRSDEEKAKVILMCQQCEFYVPQTKLGPRCKKCGCNMNVKARWATAHCPIGKW